MTRIATTKIAGSSLWLGGSFAFTKGLQLISQIVLARLLAPEDFGIWAMVLIWTTLSALFKDTSIAQVLVQRGLDDEKRVNAVYSLGVNISVGMFILQSVAGYPLSQFLGVPVLWPLTACTGLVFLLGAGTGSHVAVMQRQMRFKEIAICDAVASLARLGSSLTYALYGGGVWAFAAGELAAALTDSFLKRWLSGYRFTYHLIPDPEAIREVQGYISSIVGINLAVQANTNGDNLIIGRLLGAQSLGYYNVAYQLAMLPVFALSQINRVNFSVLSSLDKPSKKAYVCQALELYAILSAPIYGVAFVLAPLLIPWLYGPAWIAAVSIFQLVLLFAYARGFMGILGTALNALDRPDTNAAINWALVPLSIPSYLLGAWLGGTTGVAIAVAIVMGLGATIWFWVATCRVAGWKLSTFLEPVLLPSLVVVIAIVTVLVTPVPILWQPLIVLSIYGLGLVVFSSGRVPQMLLAVGRRALADK
jgi:O-antigen/teichoic acid export membrane protein